MEQSPRPKTRPRSRTEKRTVRGRPVWIDHTGEITGKKGGSYSEVTTTVPWGTGWATLPTIDGQGKRLSDEEVFKKVVEARNKLSKGGPVDFITGEELPVFSSQEKAVEYAKWRSSTMFNAEAAKKGFPEEFPMQEEPEPKGPIERRVEPYIKEGKGFLNYLKNPSKHGVFNEGGLSMLPSADNDTTPTKPKDTWNPLRFAADSWQSAKDRFADAGVTKVDANSPELYKGYVRAVDYFKDMGLGGIELVDAAAKAVIGTAGELITKSDSSQKRFERDIYSMPDAFLGAAGAKSLSQLDDAVDTAVQSAKTLPKVVKKKEQGISPVILGTDDYDPIDSLASDISALEKMKKKNSFPTIDEIMAGVSAGVLKDDEYLEQLYHLNKRNIKLYKPGSFLHDNASNTNKILEELGPEIIIQFAKNLPPSPDFTTKTLFREGQQTQNDKYSKYLESIRNEAKGSNLDADRTIQLVQDTALTLGYRNNPITERELPRAIDGDKYSRKASGYFVNEKTMPPRTKQEQERIDRAVDLGFKDVVYHTSRAQSRKTRPFSEEFTEFKEADRLGSLLKSGDIYGGPAQDLLGTHVGTARAAAERSSGIAQSGFTMELRARLDKPATAKVLANLVGIDRNELAGAYNLAESDFDKIINRQAEKISGVEKGGRFKQKDRLKAVQFIRRELAKQGYTHIPYVNDVEDVESISYIMLTDRPKGSDAVLRDIRAGFDPKKITNPDLRLAKGGVIDKQMNELFAGSK